MVTTQAPQEAVLQILQELATGRPCRLWVTGTSMVPFLRSKKDAVILKPFDGKVKQGDLLFYRRGEDQYILHRVHKVRGDGTFLLCGDNQIALEPVAPRQVVAAVAAIERSGRHFSQDQWLWRGSSAIWRWFFFLRPLLLKLMHGLWKILKG